MAGARVPLVFRLFKGDQFLREEKLTLPVIKVGKVPSSHLRLDDESVSRMHAVIEVTGPSDISIIDLGSTRGTFVNDQKVNKAKLQSGDTVLIGDIRIEVSIGGVDEEEEIPTRVQQQPQEAVLSSSPRPVAPAAAASALPMPLPPAAPPSRGGTGPQAAMPLSAPPPAFASPPPQPAMSSPAPSIMPPPGIVAPPGMRPAPAPYGTAGVPAFNPMADQVEDMGGARAVEVAAMLGDSVVTVKHCMSPRSTGKVTPATYGVFALGTLLLVISMAWFGMGVKNASFNEHKMKHWTKPVNEGGLGKPAHSFRPRMLTSNPALYDLITFGGMIGGLMLLAWGAARRRNEMASPWFRIGQDAGVEYASSDAPAGAFALVAPVGDDFVFNFAHGMEGEMTVDGQSTPLPELQAQGRARPSSTAHGGFEVPIPPKARIRVKNGKTTFLVSSVAQPRRHPVPLFAGLEANVMAYFAGSSIFFLGIWALLRTAHGGLDTANGDDDSSELAQLNGETESQEEPPPEEPEETEEDSSEESGGSGQAMALDEGKMGKKDSDKAEGQYKMKNNNLDPQLARAQALEAAKTAGILGSQAFAQGGNFASLTGTGDISSGFDDGDIYGGLLGNEAGEMNGGFGYGRSGFGPGGGGTGWGTIGTGRYGTIGHGSGTGSGYGVGGGRGGMRGHAAAVPAVRIGQPSGSGDLDKATIRRYIKRNLPKIKYCYEKELLASPGLSGTVDTQFLINPNGTVGEVHAKGVNGEVSSCVGAVLKSIEFPKPKGGGPVNVTSYPFEFHPSGG